MYKTLKEAHAKGQAPWTDTLYETDTYKVFWDGYPVTDGHLLFVPKENTPEAVQECLFDAYKQGNLSVIMNEKVTGFNIGMNVGKSAGQTCMYPHIHMIPRREGDCEDPTGGVRHVIPEKGNYKNGY